MSQKDASISDASFPQRPRSDASRSRTTGKSESSSSSSSPNPPPDNAATANYTDEVERQRSLTRANLSLLLKQEQEKLIITAENVKKDLEEKAATNRRQDDLNIQEAIARSLREQRMGQRPRYTAVKSMAKPMAKARVKKEEKRRGGDI